MTMVNILSFSYMVNMRSISKVAMILLSIMMLLSDATHSVVLESSENYIKSTTFFLKKFKVGPGKIAVKTLLDIDFPRGHIGVKSFDVEVVDEVGNSVPLYETYLHHWFAVKYIENITMSDYIKQSHDLRNGIKFERNDGACQGFLLPHYWGLGGESRGTHSNLPDPFAVELVPLKFYILDSTDHVRSNGSTPIHDCQAEYTIPRNHDNDFPHVKKADIPMTKGGYLIYGTAHMHIDVINVTLYGQIIFDIVLCTSNPKYGTGKEPGNEKGYLVGMSVCYPKPDSIKIEDGEILTLESIYEKKFPTGVMGHFYIYLAEEIPN
ncbi:hypothetical protein V8G54_031215 [Vigna mungo]|uniref:Uncharacterized protein n=1 Tax=Vigna mungo TaxID=3915 RepID=A0AAQ3MY82_VIGMU